MSTDETSDRIEKSIDIKAPIERVWRALTDHNEFGTWFRVKIDAPFAAGKHSSGRITEPGYEHVEWNAEIKEIRKPDLFSFTWHPYGIDPDVDYSVEEPTLVEFRLAEIAEGTRVTVTESGFGRIPGHRRAEAFRMNDGGWTQQVKNIKTYAES